MSTITLPNIRVGSDLQVRVRLKDGGVAIDWSTLSNIKACIYSDAQRALAGRCAFSIDEEDNTLLVCTYAANKPQYLGVNRIVISAKYMGEMKTYDKPAFSFVRWTGDQAGEEITIDDPDVDVEIDVEDVSSSILQEAVDAAFTAADRANDAAAAAEHMVDIHTGPEGKSAYEVAVEEGYTGTEEEWLASLVGPQGAQGIQGETGEAAGFGSVSAALQEDGGDPSVVVAASGEDTSKNFAFTFKNLKGDKGDKGDQGNTGSSVDYPYELVNNLTTNDATKGLTAAMGVQLEGEVSQLEAKVTDLLMNIGLADVNIDIHYSVTNNLSNCTTDNDDTTASLGEPYEATITPDDGYDLSSVAVLMGNEDITEDVYDGEGGISIPAVEGDITITAIAVEHGVTVVTFADPIVEQIAYAQGWDDNGVFTTDSLAAVTAIGTVFQGTAIETFDEFQYFTGLLADQLAQSAFRNCTALTSIVIPENCPIYGNGIFQGCSSLTNIVVPNGVTKITGSFFRECTSLVTIDLGSGIASIGTLWIQSSAAIKTIICRAATPPTADWSLFTGPSALEHIYVPAASVDTYKAAAQWSSKASIISAIPE